MSVKVRSYKHTRLKKYVLKMLDTSWHMPDCPCAVALNSGVSIVEIMNIKCDCGHDEAYFDMVCMTYLPPNSVQEYKHRKVMRKNETTD